KRRPTVSRLVMERNFQFRAGLLGRRTASLRDFDRFHLLQKGAGTSPGTKHLLQKDLVTLQWQHLRARLAHRQDVLESDENPTGTKNEAAMTVCSTEGTAKKKTEKNKTK